MSSYAGFNNPVLHRPVELAQLPGNYLRLGLNRCARDWTSAPHEESSLVSDSAATPLHPGARRPTREGDRHSWRPTGVAAAIAGSGYDRYTRDGFVPAIPLSWSRQRRLDQVIQELLSGHGLDESLIDQPLDRPRSAASRPSRCTRHGSVGSTKSSRNRRAANASTSLSTTSHSTARARALASRNACHAGIS